MIDRIITYLFWKGIKKIEKILSYVPPPFFVFALRLIRVSIKYKMLKAKLIDLLQVNRIRTKDKKYLSNAELVESEFLPELGLNNESIDAFPKKLHLFCGRGLLSWQYPNQFGKYLTKLSKLKIETYLEIGTHFGGTFIITVEYLNKFHPIKEAVGIDINYFLFLVLYKRMNPNIGYWQMDSQSLEFNNFIRKHPGFDLVLIDGDHEEEACRKDFETVKDKANIIVFHDIVDAGWLGVNRVWNEVKTKYSNEYFFFEFVDQYKSVTKRTGKSFIGIGLAIKKSYLQELKLQPQDLLSNEKII